MTKGLSFDRLVYFGDSLTDSGAFFEASSAVAFFGIPPVAAGYDGQFSDGDVYSDLVPDLLGVEGGETLNYAVGGAQTLTDRTMADVLAGTGLIRPDATSEDLAFRVDYSGQVERFLADEAGNDLAGTAVSILIGVNDFNDFVPQSEATAIAEAIAYGSEIAATALQDTAGMVAAGVGTVILNTLPALNVFPTWEALGPFEQALAPLSLGAYNATLRQGAQALEQLGADVVIVEFGAMFEEIEADFESFGFRTFDDPVVLGSNGVGGLNPDVAGIPRDQVAFFDAVHPTAELHEILGVFQAESLTSEVCMGTSDSDTLMLGKGDDLVLGRGGDDTISLGKGADIAIAGLGNDSVSGGNGADLLAGGCGNDVLSGNRGRDIIADGAGDDRSYGGRGKDLLIDGAGNDLAFGGSGSDTFIFTEASLFGRAEEDSNAFVGGRGNDTLVLRLEDVSADLEISVCGNVTHFAAIGVTAVDIETVLLVDGTGTPIVSGFDEELATAELWNFV